MNILIVNSAIHTDTYWPPNHWGCLLPKGQWDSFHLAGGDPCPPLQNYSHIILSGSEEWSTGNPSWLPQEMAIIKEAVRLEIPILGSCFGHQLMVRTLSGPQYLGVSPKPEVGWVPVEILLPDPLIQDLPNPFWTFASHWEQVVDPPPPWKVLASSADCAVQIARYGAMPVWGIQFHPEMPPDIVRPYLEANLMRNNEGDGAALIRKALASQVRDDGVAHRLVQSFLSSGTSQPPR